MELYDRLMKRIKGCEIQIQLINSLENSSQMELSGRKMVSEEKVEQMEKIIDTLDKKIEEDKVWYLKQIQ